MNTNNAHILQKESAVKPIYSLTPFTLLDYPHKTACILWFAGCNMRCSYCYNPDIVLGKGSISVNQVYAFLENRIGLLDGVVFSGGECTLHPTLIPMIEKIKKMGFLIKIDTNGSNPKILKELIARNLLDYVALDFKAPNSKYEIITQLNNGYANFTKSLQILLQVNVPFEVRTTVHNALLSHQDIQQMIDFLDHQNYTGVYYLQAFKNNVPTLGKLSENIHSIDSIYKKTQIQIVYR